MSVKGSPSTYCSYVLLLFTESKVYARKIYQDISSLFKHSSALRLLRESHSQQIAIQTLNKHWIAGSNCLDNTIGWLDNCQLFSAWKEMIVATLLLLSFTDLVFQIFWTPPQYMIAGPKGQWIVGGGGLWVFIVPLRYSDIYPSKRAMYIENCKLAKSFVFHSHSFFFCERESSNKLDFPSCFYYFSTSSGRSVSVSQITS